MDFLSEEPRPRWSKRSTFDPLLQRAATIPTQWCLAPLWPWRAITVLCLRRRKPPATQEQTVLSAEAHLLVRNPEFPGRYELPLPGARSADAPCGAPGGKGSEGCPGDRGTKHPALLRY